MNLPLVLDLDNLNADIAILGIPFGMPYQPSEMANDQSRAPDAIRQSLPGYAEETLLHYDWDLGGPLLDNREIKVVDCGNVTADMSDHQEHYRRAEKAAKKIFEVGTTLVTLGGDHGIPIPVMRALEVHGGPVTLVHVDAHLDWRHEINGETEGYSSPIRRASEMPWFDKIVQIGMRGVGSEPRRRKPPAPTAATSSPLTRCTRWVWRQCCNALPDGGPYYLTIDADGLDPTIMPAVLSQAPGGVDWLQIRTLIHGLVKKGRVLGMDLVEIAPSYDVGEITMVHAMRLICNFIGVTVRAGYYE